MERLHMPPKLINMVKALYRNPQFMVCIDGLYSEKHKQHTGIRQGCPLSPYLFILAMHNLMHDVNTEVTYIAPVMEHPSLHTVQNANFSAVLYADDTICFTNGVKPMQHLVRAIEKVGACYGLNLNKNKCIAIAYNTQKPIKFADGTHIKQSSEATYLGCDLNQNTDMSEEISKRIAKCNAILNRMHLFWVNSNCNKQFKLRVYNSVIRAKLMYGLGSAQLNPAHIRRLETFHLKGLRKILHITTTYGQDVQGKKRTNTKEYVYAEAEKELKKNQSRT
jgi:hypothetical protein